MSERLSIEGTLEETTVPDLIRALTRRSETAVLSIERTDRNDQIYVLDGQIVFATTTDPDYGVAEVLFRSGDINLENYRMVQEKVAGARRIGAVLCELGYLQADELLGAYERQVSRILRQSLGFRSGRYLIDFTADFGPEIMTLPLKTDRLVLDAVTEIDHWSLISRGLSDGDLVMQQARGSDARVFHLELTDDETHIYSLLSDPQSVRSVIEQSYLSNFITARTLWALQSVNLIEEAETSQVDENRAAVVNAIELESNVEKYNSVFQAIFRMVFQRIGDYTWDFVDRVVQHLSTDVSSHMTGINLVNEGRVDFDQLMNNLIAAGTHDARTAVYTVLNELLYGWIYEIKTEFAGELDAEVEEIIQSLKG
ncbi:MAG TPA: DUF4388 domain-containing protein [Thermoanaerobaculia bacterium]|nr:DUF4388 domain-containing protein [Thermoanaerobaculia bacterium]